MVYTRDDLNNMSKDDIIQLVLNLQYSIAELNTEVLGYKSKWSSITPEEVAKLHLQGYSLSEIVNKINKQLKADGRVDKKGKPLVITLQTVRYKLNKYEQETGQSIYRPATKGRKKAKPTVFD